MPGNVAYGVSKGSIRMLTRTAGVEQGPTTFASSTSPGAVATPINATTMSDPDELQRPDAVIPLGRRHSLARSPT